MTFLTRLDAHCQWIGISRLARAAVENESEQAKAQISHWLCEVGFLGWPDTPWGRP